MSGEKRLPDLAGEVGAAIGLRQKLHPRIELAVMDDGVLRIAGRVEHLEAGMQRGRPLGEMAPVEPAGKHDVGEEKVDRSPVLALEDGEGRFGMRRLEHAVAEVAKLR